MKISTEKWSQESYIVPICSPKSTIKTAPDWHKWVMLGVLVIILFFLIVGIHNPYYIFLTGATFIAMLEIISIPQFLAGFANEGLITIAILFGIVKPVSKTGILQFVSEKVLIFKKFPRVSLLVIMVAVASLSIFFNNTPIVALFIPIIKDWCRKNKYSPSKFLIPLSYATIAGGMCSLIGTSTNLLVHGFLTQIEGQSGFDFFEIGYVGFPCCAFLILYLFVFSFICLPNNKGGLFRILKKGKTFISEVNITKGSYLKGKTIKRVKENYNVEFIEIIRKKDSGIERIVPVPEKEIIENNDTLIVSGDMNIIMDMIHDSNIDEQEMFLQSEEPTNANPQEIPQLIVEQPDNPLIERKSLEYPKTKNDGPYSDIYPEIPSPKKNQDIIERRRSLDYDRMPRNIVSSTLIEELQLNVKKIRENVDEEENPSLSFSSNNIPTTKQTELPNDPISKLKKFFGIISSPFKKPNVDESNTIEFFEVVIGNQSRMLGVQVKDGKFQNRYGASIIAVRRHSESKLINYQDFRFKVGDTLLILAKSSFFSQWVDSNEFFVISRCNRQTNSEENKTKKIFGRTFNMTWVQYLSIPIFVGMIIAATSGVSMLKCALISLIILILFGIIESVEAYQAVDWGLMILIACSFSIGKGIENSGLANTFSSLVLQIPFPKFLLPSILFLMTQTMSSVITNNAAAAIAFPFALSMAKSSGIDIKPFAMAVAIGASAEFSTPIGYQTNLMVQGPGGYRFLDYTKIGLPLNICLFIISGLLIPLIYKIY